MYDRPQQYLATHGGCLTGDLPGEKSERLPVSVCLKEQSCQHMIDRSIALFHRSPGLFTLLSVGVKAFFVVFRSGA